MPPLAHPEPFISEHQRLRANPIDSACSSASASSFFGRLWPNRRKFAPFSKNTSVASAQEICDSSCKPSNSVGLCKGDTDANAWSMRLPKWVLPTYVQSNASSVCIAESCKVPSNELREANSNLGTQEEGMHGKDLDGEPFPDWVHSVRSFAEHQREGLPFWVHSAGSNVHCSEEGHEQELGVNPIMESLKEVLVNKLSPDKAEASDVCGNVHDRDQITSSSDNANVIMEERDQRIGSEHMLMKRVASFKAGDSRSVCGLKKMRVSTFGELQRVVSSLQCGSMEERWIAADEVLRCCKDDPIARVTLGFQLNAIPYLVSILHSLHPKHQSTALLALLNLAVGNDVNKSAIVKAKALQRMVGLLQSGYAEVQAAAVTLFLSLSALDANKAEIGASGCIPFLVTLMLKEHSKKDALRILYNLSIHADNVKSMVEAGCVPLLLHLVSDTNMADKALATLSNLAGMDTGRLAFGEHKEVAYAVLIDVMRWVEMPKCQERAVYVLMMIAHHSPVQREAMAAAGVIPALVELSLLGSTLAQKRATRTLDSFRRAKAFSGPQQRQCPQAEMPCANGPQSMTRAVSEKKVVDGLVRQSLHRTMQRIARRANLSMVGGEPMPASGMPTSRSFRRPVDRRSSSCSLPF